MSAPARPRAVREQAADPPRPRPSRVPDVLRAHWLFGLLFAAGLALRVVTQLAYRPALLYIDSFAYLRDMVEMVPGRVRPIGYPALVLRPLSVFGDLAAYSAFNHLLGLAMALAIYAFLLRWRAPRWLAALAAAPVLLDSYQLQIEQNVMSDPVFQAMLLAALLILSWRLRPGPVAAGAAGLLLGLAVTVRLVGQPLIVPAVLFVLLAGGSWRRRSVAAVTAIVMFALPVLGYAALYRSAHGEFSLSAVEGRVHYARVARFVDCATVPLPEHQRALCPTPQQQAALSADDLIWGPQSPIGTFQPPPGRTVDEELGAFARSVIRAQPVDYAWAVTRDFAKFFQWFKVQSPQDVALSRWQFQPGHPDYSNGDPERTVEAVAARVGGTQGGTSPALVSVLRSYQFGGGYTPGTVLLLGLLAGLAGTIGLGRARRSPLRVHCLLWTAAGGGILLASSLFEFSWRYQLPGLVLLPVAGVLGATALLGRFPGRDLAAPGDVPGAGGAEGPASLDDVDEKALADFAERSGDVHLAPVAIVIAAYNEAEGIGPVLAELPDRVGDLPVDVVVVDDGSNDGTADVAMAAGVHTCRAPLNRGQGAALRLGYRIARERGADYIVTLDADGQYDPADIPVVLEPLLSGEADFVTGSRRLGREETDDGLRKAGVRVFAWLVSLLTGQRITDTSNGLRAMRAEVTGAVTLAQPQYQASELLIGVLARGYRVVERPTTMRARNAGESKKGNNLLYGSRYARVVLGTWWRERGARSTNSSRSKTRNLTTNSTP